MTAVRPRRTVVKPVTDTFTLFDTLRPGTQFLPSGDHFEVRFTPQAGLVTAGFGTVTSTQPREEDPERGELLTVRVSLRIQLIRPRPNPIAREHRQSGNVLLSHDFRPLTYNVTAEEAGGTWTCRFTNEGEFAVRLRPTIEFASAVHPVQHTAIPLRALNHGLAQVVRALALRIRLDGERSFVDFSDDFERLSGGAARRRDLDIPLLELIQDVNLSAIDVGVISPIHTLRGRVTVGPPAIRIRLQFETRGREVDTFFVDADLDNAVLDVHLAMAGDVDDRGRQTGTVRLTSTVRARLAGRLDVLDIDLSPTVLADLATGLQDAVETFLVDALPAVGEYLARGLAQLCGFGHRFVDVTSDATNLLVSHYDPDDASPPSFPLLEAPFTLTDTFTSRQTDAVGLGNLDRIDNIVVLVQENRSFDHLLGYLRADLGRTDVDGLRGTEQNSAPGRSGVKVHPLSDTVFTDDPPHDFEEVLRQVGDGAMDGFVAAFVDRHPGDDFTRIMGYHTQRRLPTYDFLASQFLICDRWFCSHPGPTQPNRMSLVLGGRIPDLGNFTADSPALGFLRLPTLFDLLTDGGVDWVYYEQDVAFLRFFDRYRLDDEHIVPFDDRREGFTVRAAAGTLPKVTFIEPSFLNVLPDKPANDDHPPTDIRHGQDAIACIYNALVSSPQWDKTMFVITYDEHGGFYDHVAPPGTARSTTRMTVPPLHPRGPSFYGVRVPTFVVSPWVVPGSVDSTVFDHTSIAKTILLKFLRRRGPSILGDFHPRYPAMGSRRLLRAAHLGRVLTLATPRLTVPQLPGPCPPPAAGGRRAPKETRPDDFHEGMRRLGEPKVSRP
jgi:phosphoesterase family protein